MKRIIGDNFGSLEKYKIYRSVYDVLHPTISKKNISNYKVVFDEKLLPVLVYYPKKISNLKSIIIYIPGDGKVNGSFGKYSNVCNSLAKETDSVVIAVDYFESSIKYPTIVNKIYKLIKFLFEELSKCNINNDKITLMSDSVGCKIMGSVVIKLLSKGLLIDRTIMFYPVVKDDYSNYLWNESLMSVNFNLDKRVNDFLKKYFSKNGSVNCDLLELIYFKNFPKTLVVTGDMDIFKDDGILLGEKLVENVFNSSFSNIKFANHGFLSSNDEEIQNETYKIINKFLS